MNRNIVILALLGIGHLSQAESQPSAEELLQATDRSRGAAISLEGLTWTADILTVENGEKSQMKYLIKARENNAIAEAISPPRQKGEIILFNDRTLWFFKPGVKKPVNISPRQKLVGQAANGDIASTHYARDYDGVVVGAEKVGETLTWKLELKAKAKNVTYDKIHYWIDQKEKLGVRAEFVTVSGEVFKVAQFKYKNTMNVRGKSYPFVSEMTITDAHRKDNFTTINYQSPHEAAYSPSIFNVNNLIK